MKQSYFIDVREIFPGSSVVLLSAKPLLSVAPDFFPVHDVVRKDSFKAMRLGDSYALLAVILPNLAAFFGLSRGESALFQKKDCFECPLANAKKRVCWPGGRVYPPRIKGFSDAKTASSTRIAA